MLVTSGGHHAAPTVGVDLARLATNAATRKLQDRLLKRLGLEEPEEKSDGATADTATTDSSTTDSATTDKAEPEKSDKDVARDALKKGLRDLFKR